MKDLSYGVLKQDSARTNTVECQQIYKNHINYTRISKTIWRAKFKSDLLLHQFMVKNSMIQPLLQLIRDLDF